MYQIAGINKYFMELTYNNYLQIDKLLNLQELQSHPKEHDEMLFITIHQTYELWFKQVLHEFNKLRDNLENGKTWAAAKTMKRNLTILKTMVAQIDILETMTPLEFGSFRNFLDEASGFQSVQFREIEILCGHRSPRMVKAFEDDPKYVRRLKQRMKESTLWECFCTYLQANDYDIQSPGRKNERGLLHDPSLRNQKVLLEIMTHDPEKALLCDLLVDFVVVIQEWRDRLVSTV